ncbi:Aluminum-activated malate transporter [Sesbania bispinosa]|nr:Aluminum-activated malate transporter [Sesbania bispinosa]
MAHDKQVEWRITVADHGSLLERRTGLFASIWAVITGLAFKLNKFLTKAWEVGVNDPRKVIHCLKVGIALSAVSFFYYLKPLYDGVGGNAMWAVMTVIVVFEFTAATFSRFIPSIKARFDYGAMIFILTFSLVSVSGYRIDELLPLAQQRISTIIIGTSLCIIVSMTIRPIWAGQELFVSITGNLDKLANSLQACVTQYFNDSQVTTSSDEESNKKLLGYKCVLNSKAAEESMANLARWEPAHGRFNFRHPWKQYLKIGASMRSCASCIDALIGCIDSENKSSDEIKNNMSSISMKVGLKTASVIRELATTIRNMTKSHKLDVLVVEMNDAAQELQNFLKHYPKGAQTEAAAHGDEVAAKVEIPLMEIIQVVTVASLLIEIVVRVEEIVKAVEELSDLAEFQPAMCDKSKQHTEKNEEAIKTLQIV